MYHKIEFIRILNQLSQYPLTSFLPLSSDVVVVVAVEEDVLDVVGTTRIISLLIPGILFTSRLAPFESIIDCANGTEDDVATAENAVKLSEDIFLLTAGGSFLWCCTHRLAAPDDIVAAVVIACRCRKQFTFKWVSVKFISCDGLF